MRQSFLYPLICVLIKIHVYFVSNYLYSVIIHVHVKPNVKTDSIIVTENNELEVRIHEAPVDGKANKYLVNYLSKVFKISRSSITILKGLNTPHKTIAIIADAHYLENILSTLKKT
jgi:uncharacterized protein